MKRSVMMQPAVIAFTITVIFVCSFAIWGQTLLLRPFWMDEVHSWLLISDPDVNHALNALRRGADYNPPVYYLVARAFHSVVPLTEHNLRVLSGLLTIGTSIGLALVFARRMTWLAAVGSSLLICSQSLVILQSTEARFYALWLCLLTWFCLLLTSHDGKQKVVRIVLLSVLAASIAGTHYFGIISVGLACVAFAAANRFRSQSIVRAIIPFGAAVVAVACCLPLLRGQKAALTAATWVKPATLESAVGYVTQFFPALLLLVAGAVWLAGVLLRPVNNENAEGDTERVVDSAAPSDTFSRNSDLFVFGSMLLMPLILIAFSVVVQPATVNRYAVAATVWLVPVISWLLKTTDGESKKSVLVFVAGCLMFAIGVRQGSATWNFNLTRQRQLASDLEDVPDDQIVLFENRIDYWLAQHRSPQKMWFQLDFESADADGLTNLRIVQRDVGRAIQPLYPGRFPMKTVHDVSETDFYLVPYPDRDPQSAIVETERTVSELNGCVKKVLAEKVSTSAD